MTTLDASQDAYARAAFAWGTQGRLDQMRNCVAKLDRAMVLDTMRACAELTAELADRYDLLVREAGGLEPALVAAAALTPDALPDSIDGRAG